MEKTQTAQIPRIRAKTPIGILKAVVKIIRAEPLRYDQSDWVVTAGHWRAGGKRMPPCGTVCCVAGWTAIGCGLRTNALPREVDRFAQYKLGLTPDQAYRLFDGGAVKGKPGTKRYVENGVKHIERFMRDELGYTGPKL